MPTLEGKARGMLMLQPRGDMERLVQTEPAAVAGGGMYEVAVSVSRQEWTQA